MGSSCSSGKTSEASKSPSHPSAIDPSQRSSPDGAPQQSEDTPSVIENEADRKPSPSDQPKEPGVPDEQTKQDRIDDKKPESVLDSSAHFNSTTKVASLSIPAISKQSEQIQKLLCGQLEGCEPESRQINVYHVANPEDSEEERDALLEKVYPKLRKFCAEHQYELNLIDLHWGVQNEAVYQSAIWDACAQTVEGLKNTNTSKILVIFMNEKYGSMCPDTIPSGPYEKACDNLDAEEKRVVTSWFEKNESVDPVIYQQRALRAIWPNQKLGDLEGWKAVQSKYKETRDQVEDVLKTTGLACTSCFEEQINQTVLNEDMKIDGTVVLRRTFKPPCPDDCRQYVDVKDGSPDDTKRTKLQNLRNKLMKKVDQNHVIESEITWTGKGVNRTDKKHEEYLDSVCKKLEEILKEILTKVFEQRAVTRKRPAAPGVTKVLHTELLHQSFYCEQHSSDDSSQAAKEELTQYIRRSSKENTHPLVVCDGSGWGNKALPAALCKSHQNVDGRAAVSVIRFAGSTNHSQTLDQILTSVGEQLCVLCGFHPASGHQDMTSNSNFSRLLSSVPASLPVIIFLADLDAVVYPGSPVDWLPSSLPNHIRLIITTAQESTLHTLLKTHLKDTKYFYSLPSQEPSNAERYRKSLPSRVTESSVSLIADKIQSCPTKSAYSLLEQCIYLSSRTGEPVSLEKLDSSKGKTGIVEFYFDILDKLYGAESVGRILAYLCESKQGLSESELLDLLSTDETFLMRVHIVSASRVRRAPFLVWQQIKSALRPVLRWRHLDGYTLACVSGDDVVGIARRRYEKLFSQISNALLDYFEERWANGKKMPCADSKGGIDIVKDRYVLSQPVRYGDVPNRRKLAEVPYQLSKLQKRDKITSKYILNLDWLCCKLAAGALYQLIQEVRLQLTEENSEDLKLLLHLLLVYAYWLRQAEGGFSDFLHLYVKRNSIKLDGKVKQIKQMFDKTSALVGQQLLPTHELKLVSSPERNIQETKHKVSRIFRMKDDAHHVITIEPQNGRVNVWNIQKREMVRQLTGIDTPTNVKMIDSYRAVIHCKRELKIYNLDQGSFESKVKGFLNIKMPYYEIEDSNHVIMLSRNRMYVNVVQCSSGDTVATFKAGEDRFMNSLLVSENGEKCVCGDEVQKPFPLLVWDLPNRKLLHDMRMAGHEFITSMSDITHDGHYVACVGRSLDDPVPNFVAVYDLESGALFKKWMTDQSPTCVAISSRSHLVLSALDNGNIIVWDLVGGGQRWLLTGHCSGADHLSLNVSGDRCVSWDSSGLDTSVRLWDLPAGKCLGTFQALEPISCCEISSDGTEVVMCLPSVDDVITLRPRGAGGSVSDVPTEVDHIYGDASRKGQTVDVSNAG